MSKGDVSEERLLPAMLVVVAMILVRLVLETLDSNLSRHSSIKMNWVTEFLAKGDYLVVASGEVVVAFPLGTYF